MDKVHRMEPQRKRHRQFDLPVVCSNTTIYQRATSNGEYCDEGLSCLDHAIAGVKFHERKCVIQIPSDLGREVGVLRSSLFMR